jgi:tRNA pseudouridine38-40 synthase
MNVKLTLAYCGTHLKGWQKTPVGPSIEEILEQALSKILQDKITLQAASRTDAGVHAEGQIVNFFLKKPFNLNRLKWSLNALLSPQIAVLQIEEMPLEFHPTLDALKKEYWYHICNVHFQLPFHRDTSWHFPYPLDSEAMRRASLHMQGSHDFSAFCNERNLWDRDPVCHLESIEILSMPNDRLQIKMTGNHFLYKMARNLVGTLVYSGCGKLEESAIPKILKSQDRTQAGITAPAHGLTLKRVFYHDVQKRPLLVR